jgi:hypothetical protein
VTYFDEAMAARYDDPADPMNSTEVIVPAVDLLADLAGDGRALEFAIGTGRIAVPLAARGVEVHGIEISEPMIGVLRSKPGAVGIDVAVGDMSTTKVDSSFSLVYLVYNTISNLLEQDQQVACFVNAADHLESGGVFVVETGVPRLRRLGVGETLLAFDVSAGHVGVDEFDVVGQRLTSHHYWIEDGTAATFSSTHRYAWPAEYDLMARIAGMELVDRWGGWGHQPFTAESDSHVSVWRKIG